MKKPSYCYRHFIAWVLTVSFILVGQEAQAAEKTTETKIIISHGIAMHDQPKYPADFTRFAYTSPKAQKGGSVTLAALGTYDSLNPFIAKGTPDAHSLSIYDTLTVKAADEPATHYGLVAEKIEYPEDRAWVIFHLNPKARFHDGKFIQASDVVFSFNTLVAKGAPLFALYYADVKEAVVLDKQRVKFTFKTNTNRELPLILGDLPVLPEHYWLGKAFDRSSLDIPLGSGPYKIKSIDAGRSIVYERVENYWGKDLPVNNGLYNFDIMKYEYYRDFTVMTEALKAGQIDFRWENISKSWATSYDTPAIKNGSLKKQVIASRSPQGIQAIGFNLRRPPFDNIKVRQAFNYAFDFEWTNRNLFYDLYARSNSYFFNSDLAASGLPQGRELEILTQFKSQLPETIFATPYTNPITDGSGNNRENLRKAQTLLAEAGYKLVNGKLVDPKTQKPLSFEYLTYDPSWERVLNPYVQNLRRLGIELTLRQVDVSQYTNRMNSRDFDLFTLRLAQSLSPGNEQFEYWGSKAADIEGSRNELGVKSPVVDALINLIINAPNRSELVASARALDRVLLQNYYSVPQWSSVSHRLVYWDKFSQPETAPAFDLSFEVGFATWWFDAEKAKRITASKN